MEKKINDGGPAYPSNEMDFQPGTGEQVVRHTYPGMSVRMRIAIESIKMVVDDCVNIADTSKELGVKAEEYDYRVHWKKIVAKRAFEMADAMIEASGEYK